MQTHVCAKIRVFLYVITCPGKGHAPDTAAGQGTLRSTAQVLHQECGEDGRVGTQTQPLHTSPTVPQMCNPVTSGCTFCILRPACVNLFTSLEASLLCLKKQSQKHTHTRTYSHQGIIYVLEGSKLILWTSIISSSRPRPVFLVRIKNRRHVRHFHFPHS